jgi:hypothetical protein
MHTPLLVQQMDSLLQHGDQILHGPNTLTRFPAFSLKAIAEEIEKNAPDVYQLFCQLGDTDRNPTTSNETSVEQWKAIMSMSTILNARCRTANGLQLLLSFMLIARADWNVDWNDTAPQHDPAALTISDLLLGEADGTELLI